MGDAGEARGTIFDGLEVISGEVCGESVPC
jgi:hypothetical protein